MEWQIVAAFFIMPVVYAFWKLGAFVYKCYERLEHVEWQTEFNKDKADRMDKSLSDHIYNHLASRPVLPLQDNERV